MYSKSNSTSFLVKKWSRWWSKNPTFRSFSHSFWSPFIHLRSLRFADSWLKFGENRRAMCDFFSQSRTNTDKYGQIRTNTDGHYFFCRIFAPSELNDAAELFPYWHLQIPLVCLSAHKGDHWRTLRTCLPSWRHLTKRKLFSVWEVNFPSTTILF